MAQLVRFVPLDGVPDADARGAGEFHWDDGKVDVAEDPELADLVKSYQDTLPQLEAQTKLPDLRLASNDPGFALSPEQQAMTAASPGDPSLVPPPPKFDPIQDLADKQAAFDAGVRPAPTPVRVAVPSAPAIQPTASDLPAPPTDASRAADLHRMAGQEALRGKYVPGQKAGYVPGQRTGALDPALAARQAQERGAVGATLAEETERARAAEAEGLRQAALGEAMKISVQKAEQERIAEEAKVKAMRLKDERKRLNDEPIDRSFAQGNEFRQAMAILGSALLGATGSDTGIRMIQSNIDGWVAQQLKIRGSKLQALAEELGSEEQAAAGAKAKLYALAEKETANSGKLYDAAKIEHQTPAVLAEMKARRVENEQQYERESLGKTTEVYQQGRAAGRTGPNFDAAAKQYDAAAKSSEPTKADEDKRKATEERGRKVAGLERIRDTLARGEQSGALQSVVGWQDKLGANSVQEFFGGLPADQQQQATALGELQVDNLMRLVREPNNKRTQDMVQAIGVPKNDKEIRAAIQRLDEIIAMEKQDDGASLTPTQVR